MKKLFIIPLLVCLFSFGFVGDSESPVKFKFDSKFNGGNEYDLMIRAIISPKWHIYSTTLMVDAGKIGPIATKITITESPDYEIYGKLKEQAKVITQFDNNFEMNVAFIEKEALFIQRIKIKNFNLKSIKGQVEYMSCDDSKCLPPVVQDFEIKLFKKGRK